MRIKSILLSATAGSLLLPLSPALAQDVADRDPSEIVVTARKRQESILNVPVVATVLDSAVIERSQVKDVVDIAKKTTGLQLGMASTETGTLISMRGFGTTAIDPGVDQSVSLNLDGLQVTQGMAYSIGFFDMAQVEVLKGPQALFFGKASPAGVVSIRTNDPGDELEVKAQTGYEFVAREWRNELILSAPLGEGFGIRLAGMYDHFGGFFKNVETARANFGALPMPKRFGETKTIFFRGTVLAKPAPEFTARLKVNYSRDRQHGAQPGQLVDCPEGPNAYGTLPNFFSDNEDCKTNRTLAIVGMNPAIFPAMNNNSYGLTNVDGGLPAAFTTQKFGTLELNYDPTPELNITSLTGYYKLRTNVDFNCIYNGGAAPGCMTEKRFTRREFTQELRVASDFEGPINFTLGGFFQDGRITDTETLPGNTSLFGGFFPRQLFAGDHDLDIKALSFFGQLRWQVVPQLELAAGARWTHEKRQNNPTTEDVFGATTGIPGTIMNITQPKLDSKNWSPEFTITYKPTEDVTIFADLKQAYKSGSFNLITPTQPRSALLGGPQCTGSAAVGFTCIGGDQSFQDERIRGGEIGIKARLADRQLNVNLAGYYYKLADQQVGVVLPFAGVIPILLTLNAATSKIYGVEADFNFRPRNVPGLEISGAINYNHARFGSFIAPCGQDQLFSEGCNLIPGGVTSHLNTAFSAPNNLPPGVTVGSLPVQLQGGAPFRYNSQDLAGAYLARSPDWSGNIGVYYEMPVGGDMELGLGADAQFSSKYITNTARTADKRWFQGSYAKFNFNVALRGPDDGWEVAFIGNNLFNEYTKANLSQSNYAGGAVNADVVGGGFALGTGGRAETFGVIDRGRELWIRLTVRPTSMFGGGEEPAAPPPPPPPPPATQTCPDGSQVPAEAMCPPPPAPPPPPEPELKAGERG